MLGQNSLLVLGHLFLTGKCLDVVILRWLETMIKSWPIISDRQKLMQMVNLNEASQVVDVEVKGLLGSPSSMMVTTLNSTDGAAENSFDTPFLVGSLLADLFTSTCCELSSGAKIPPRQVCWWAAC